MRGQAEIFAFIAEQLVSLGLLRVLSSDETGCFKSIDFFDIYNILIKANQ